MKTYNITIALLVIFLTACATSGNRQLENHTETTIPKHIVEGKTTQSQITSYFGNATSVTFTDSGNEVWTYKFERAVPHASSFIPFVRLISSGANVSVKELVVMFDQNAVVSRYTMREITREVKTGIMH